MLNYQSFSSILPSDYALFTIHILPLKNLFDKEDNPLTTYQVLHHMKPQVSQFKVCVCLVIFKHCQPYWVLTITTEKSRYLSGLCLWSSWMANLCAWKDSTILSIILVDNRQPFEQERIIRSQLRTNIFADIGTLYIKER